MLENNKFKITAIILLSIYAGNLISSYAYQSKMEKYEYNITYLERGIKNRDDIIENLERSIQWYKRTLQRERNETLIKQAYNYTVLYAEDFDDSPIGSVPEGWMKDSVSINDTMAVQNIHSYSKSNSLYLHEDGGDAVNARAVLSGFSQCQSFAFELRIRVEGGWANRATVHVMDDNNKSIYSVHVYGYENEPHRVSEAESTTVKWHHMKLLFNGEYHKVKDLSGGSISKWRDPKLLWNKISSIVIAGNSEYPSDICVDDIIVYKIT